MRTAWNAIACIADGKKYKSLWQVSVDYGLDYPWLLSKLRRSMGAPVTISGHTVMLASWLEKHSASVTDETPVRGANSDKEGK